jgi:hypothetical protein
VTAGAAGSTTGAGATRFPAGTEITGELTGGVTTPREYERCGNELVVGGWIGAGAGAAGMTGAALIGLA